MKLECDCDSDCMTDCLECARLEDMFGGDFECPQGALDYEDSGDNND